MYRPTYRPQTKFARSYRELAGWMFGHFEVLSLFSSFVYYLKAQEVAEIAEPLKRSSLTKFTGQVEENCDWSELLIVFESRDFRIWLGYI